MTNLPPPRRRRVRSTLCPALGAVLTLGLTVGAAQTAPSLLPASRASMDAAADAAAFLQEGSHGGGMLTKRRALGVAFLAGGAMLAAKGFDYRDQADAFYDAYETATDATEIDKFYQRTTNRDVKSQVSWALAAACGITGLRLLLTGGDDYSPTATLAAPPSGGSRTAFVPTASAGAVGLQLQRRFH